jgi:hypothetical protein
MPSTLCGAGMNPAWILVCRPPQYAAAGRPGTAKSRLLDGRPSVDQLLGRRQELEVGAPKSEQQVEHHS